MPGPNRGAGPRLLQQSHHPAAMGPERLQKFHHLIVSTTRATFKMPGNHIFQVVVTHRHRICVAMADRHRRRRSPLSYSG